VEAVIVPGYTQMGSEVIITVLACGVDLASQDATGEVTDGFVCSSGSAIPSCISRKQDNQSEDPDLDISLDLQSVKIRGGVFEDVYLGTQ